MNRKLSVPSLRNERYRSVSSLRPLVHDTMKSFRMALPLRRAKPPPVDAGLLHDGPRQLLQPAHGVALDEAEARRPAVALDRHALGDGRSFGQHAAEGGIAPMRREVDEIVDVAVRIDEPGQGDERQVG